MKTLFAILISMLLFGCASVPDNVAVYRKTLNFAKVDGKNLAYLERGPANGPVIFLMRGLPTSSYLYRNVINSLAAKGSRVIAPDFLGFGASDKPTDVANYDFVTQARRTLALMDQLNISQANLVVHDMGGLIAWEMLGLQPGRFDRILIMNTTAYTQGFEPPFEMRMLGGMFGGMMAGMMENSATGPMLTKKFVSGFMGRPEKLTDADVNQYWWPLHEGATVPMRYIAQNFDRIMEQFPRYQGYLNAFVGPVYMLWGAKDEVLRYDPIALQFRRDMKIAPARTRVLADAGHFVQEDAPQAVVDVVLQMMGAPIGW